MLRKSLLIATATASLCLSQAAQAAIHTANFTIQGQWNSSGTPYGVPNGQSQSGSVWYDDTQTGTASIVGLSYTTGSRTWTLADVTSAASSFSGGNLTSFNFIMVDNNYVYSNNTANISEPGVGFSFCNGCVSFTSSVVNNAVPEPATWAILILGFAGLGSAMRRQRREARVAYAG